jgi:hypothetical protein
MYEAWNLREVLECLDLGVDVTPLPLLYMVTTGQLSQVHLTVGSAIPGTAHCRFSNPRYSSPYAQLSLEHIPRVQLSKVPHYWRYPQVQLTIGSAIPGTAHHTLSYTKYSLL